MSLHAALNGPNGDEWLKSLHSELTFHAKFKTLGPALTKAQLPPGVRSIPFDTTLKVKRCGRKKVRCIVKGFHLTDGVDYNETYAGVPDLTIIRVLLAIVALNDYELDGSDALTAFLQSTLDTIIVVQVPDWFHNPNPNFDRTRFTYHILQKAVPDIPQGPRMFKYSVLTNVHLPPSHVEDA